MTSLKVLKHELYETTPVQDVYLQLFTWGYYGLYLIITIVINNYHLDTITTVFKLYN